MRKLSGRMQQGIHGYFDRFEERAGFEPCPGEDAGECGSLGLALAGLIVFSALTLSGGLALL